MTSTSNLLQILVSGMDRSFRNKKYMHSFCGIRHTWHGNTKRIYFNSHVNWQNKETLEEEIEDSLIGNPPTT